MPDVIAIAARRRRSRRIVVGLVLLVGVVLLAGPALTRLDAGFLRARMEAAAFHATGRRLAIAGPIHLILFPSPGFVADDVTLANIAGGSRPAMAHADAVQATLDLGALLGQRVIVRSLVLTDPDILVERTADGQPNWVFTPPAKAPPPRVPGELLPPVPSASAHVKLTISSIEMEGGQLTWRNLARLGDGSFAIRHLDAQQQQETSSFTLFLAGQHATTPFSLSLASGPPQALQAGRPAHPFPLRGSLSLGSSDRNDEAPDQLTVDGQFADPLHGRGFAGIVHARLAALGDLDGLFPHAGLPAAQAVRLEARLAQGADGSWTVSSLHAGMGAADAERALPGLALAHLSVDAPDSAAPVVVHAAGTLRGQLFAIDAPAFGSLAAWNGGGAAPLDVAASLGRAKASLHGTIARGSDGGARLDAASSLDLPDPGALAAAFGRTLDRHDAIASQGHLVATRMAGGELTAALDAARLLIDARPMPASRFELDRRPEGTLRVDLALEAAPPWLVWRENPGHEPPDFTAVLDGHRVPATLVAALAGAGRGLSGPLDLAGTITGTAPGGRIDLAHLDGTLSATLVDGTIAGGLLAPALRATHLPLGTGGAERVRCAGFAGQVASGVVTLSSLSLDSRLLAIDGSGTVSLPTGALDLHLRPVVRIGVAAASAPVVIGGTIAAPEASLAHDEHGRVALSFGQNAPGSVACDANPDVAALPPPKAAKPVDILRSLGLFR